MSNAGQTFDVLAHPVCTSSFIIHYFIYFLLLYIYQGNQLRRFLGIYFMKTLDSVDEINNDLQHQKEVSHVEVNNLNMR